MTRTDRAFAKLTRRMEALTVPPRPASMVTSIASLLDRVEGAKARYQPRASR